MRRPRRNHSSTFKAKVAIAAVKGDKTLAELAEQYDVHANQITQWKTQLLDGALGVIQTPVEKREAGGGASAKRSGRAKLNSAISGNSGYKAGPKAV